jgi:predicted GNAT family acetyltransferase
MSVCEALKVVHDAHNCAFAIDFDRQTQAVLEYAFDAKTSVFDLYHTEVPAKLRGQSIGLVLAHAAFEHIASIKGAQMLLSCTYLSQVAIVKLSEFAPLVAKSKL